MASRQAIQMKGRLIGTIADDFEHLTFGDLEIGQKFICFPTPGDNSGHGGFKPMHYIWRKTRNNIRHRSNLRFVSTGEAERESNGVKTLFPLKMPVILVG